MSMGCIRAGISFEMLNDIDKTCCETLLLNHKNINIVCGDMCNLDLSGYNEAMDFHTKQVRVF